MYLQINLHLTYGSAPVDPDDESRFCLMSAPPADFATKKKPDHNTLSYLSSQKRHAHIPRSLTPFNTSNRPTY
jgi:hypothetical protein